MVETITPVRPRKKTRGKKWKRFARIYCLEYDKSQTIGSLLSKIRCCRTNDVSDGKGKAEPGSKKKNGKTSGLVNHHILGYNPSASHYQRIHVPDRLYISLEHKISAMFKEFCSRYEDVKISYAYYYMKVKKK